jgi:hypothetical protein
MTAKNILCYGTQTKAYESVITACGRIALPIPPSKTITKQVWLNIKKASEGMKNGTCWGCLAHTTTK